MMSQSDLPISFWGYALETAAFDKLAPKSDKCRFVGYPKETKIVLRTMCFLHEMLYFWRESTYPKELVGVKFSLKKFEYHKEALNRLWKLNRFHKMLLNLHKYHNT